jgi:hypothetical protein
MVDLPREETWPAREGAWQAGNGGGDDGMQWIEGKGGSWMEGGGGATTRAGAKGRAARKGPPVGTRWFRWQIARARTTGWRHCPYNLFRGREKQSPYQLCPTR